MESPGKRLAKQLHDPDAARRIDAANQLGAMAEAGTLDDGPLQQLINTFEMDDTPEVQAAVINALGKSCHPAAMEILVRSLDRETPRINSLTLSLLGANAGFRVMEKIDAFSKRMDDEGTPEALILKEAADSASRQIKLRGGRRETCQPLQPLTPPGDSNENPAEAGSGPS
ncbi:MAG TPA: HEAT repeat domain-containing protein [Fluviicoccus sp.]|nr:HEAT repeat domain-containing protein [Fluviicoccus sp.]